LTEKMGIDNNRLSMKGTIRTLEKCPTCRGLFRLVEHPHIQGDIIDLICVHCEVRPHFYFIDARDMKAGRIYTDRSGLKFDSFLAAHRTLEKMRTQIDEGTFDPNDWIPAKRRELLFVERARKWLKKLKRRVGYSQFRHCKTAMHVHLIPELKDFDVRDIRTTNVDDVYDKLYDKGLSPKSIKNYLDVLKEFMNYLHRREVITRMPVFDKIEIPAPQKKWINQDQQKRILSHIPHEHILIIETLIETAERPSSVCAHMKRDLVERNEIIIDKAFDEAGNLKAEKENQIIHRGISSSLYFRLVKQCENKLPNAWIFTQPDGSPYSAYRLWEIWREAAGKAGIDISVYPGTRHSRASQKRLEKEKEVAEAVSRELGHKSSKTTKKHYALDRSRQI
jgi:integrase